MAYLAAWTASYSVVLASRGDGLDFAHYFEYLWLAWTFGGGELPSFVWIFSVVAFVPLAVLAVLAVFLVKRYERRKNVDSKVAKALK